MCKSIIFIYTIKEKHLKQLHGVEPHSKSSGKHVTGNQPKAKTWQKYIFQLQFALTFEGWNMAQIEKHFLNLLSFGRTFCEIFVIFDIHSFYKTNCNNFFLQCCLWQAVVSFLWKGGYKRHRGINIMLQDFYAKHAGLIMYMKGYSFNKTRKLINSFSLFIY